MTSLRYERPTTVAEAAALLAREPGRAVVLAGGTDLMLTLRSGQSRPDLIVDVKHIPGMTEIRWMPGGDLVIGAAVTMARIYSDRTLCERYPALAEGARQVGSIQVQERATIGGNLCNASPCMDTAPGLLVLGAHGVAVSAKGERKIPVKDLFKGVKKTTLEAGEILTSLVVPESARALATAFDKIKRVRGHDLALVNAAAAYDRAAGTMVLSIGSCATTPLLTAPVTGVDPSRAEEVGQRLADAALAMVRPIDDVRSSAEYRRDMTALLARRLAARLLGAPRGR